MKKKEKQTEISLTVDVKNCCKEMNVSHTYIMSVHKIRAKIHVSKDLYLSFFQ